MGLRMQRHRSRPAGPKTAESLFGEVIREFRKRQGFSQEELAFNSGYSTTYIGQLERGQKSPSLRTILSLAGALKTRGSDLLLRFEALSPVSRIRL